MASPLITLRDATVAHADGLPPVLHDVSITVEPGDWIALSGGNGSGKTTLLAVLGGVLPLRAGEVERAPDLRVALLLQEPDNQLVASSVRRELALSVPVDVDETARRARIQAAIDRFELGALLDRNPHRLSGGEKQRLALATVWLESPDVLLLDEPLSYLDRDMRERVTGFAREMNANGVAIVWATPGGEELALARRTFHLRDGRAAGAPVAPPAVQPASARGPRDAVRGTERLRFDSVSFAYDGMPVLDDIGFSLNGGDCACVTGRNGSGKSTLLLLAGGALDPVSGRIVRSAGERGVLYLPQSPERLFFAETVIEEVSFGLERRGSPRAAANAKAREALARAALAPDEFARRSPFELSFGEMRRVAFAIAFALEPGILLLDEPASCLDADGIAVLDDLVAYCTSDARGAVMIATHNEVPGLTCDRIINLDHSKAGGAAPVDGPRQPG